MTLDELKSLREGEFVVITKVDEKISKYYNYRVGDELIFYQFNDDINHIDFIRISGEYRYVSHFSYRICHYIERKVNLERDNKLKELGI